MNIAAICSTLLREKSHHKEMMFFYSKAFNKTGPVPGEYSPLQEFLQSMTEYHQSQMMGTEVLTDKFLEIADEHLLKILV